VAVFGGVVLAGLLGMVGCVVQVALRYMGMVSGFFMMASLIVFRGGMVMFGGVFVVFGSFAVVLSGIFRHMQLSFRRSYGARVSSETWR
jgi:hypothetical protein